MRHDELKQRLRAFGIELSKNHVKEVEGLINSGKMDFHMIKKCLLPELPNHLLSTSLTVMQNIEINL